MSSEKRDNDFFLSDPRLFVPAVPWLGLPAPLSDCDSERPALPPTRGACSAAGL